MIPRGVSPSAYFPRKPVCHVPLPRILTQVSSALQRVGPNLTSHNWEPHVAVLHDIARFIYLQSCS